MTEVSFGEWLKRQRMGKGLTREQLADQIGCAVITLRKIESEERHPSEQIAERIADIFNVPGNERKSFLRFTRGDPTQAPSARREESPWQGITQAARTNLRVSLTSFIGRDKEVADVREYISDPATRLITLLGPPGIGKTRLSLAVAHASIHQFTDGVFFVELAQLEDPNLVALTVAQTLGVVEKHDRSPSERLKDAIKTKRMLIVLDNIEHLLNTTAAFVSELLSACPHLKILTTSREPLRSPGEWLYPLPALQTPTSIELQFLDLQQLSQFTALRLFTERARAAQPDFALNAENVQTVTLICTRLDGLPLAIELIAARVRVMSVQYLLSQMSEQFILSADGMRSIPARQKTLQNAIGWSYNFLTDNEQILFRRLAVFAGGWTSEIAEQVCSDEKITRYEIVDSLGKLVDKSLVTVIQNKTGIRYRMLETIRQYARKKLVESGENEKIRDQHLKAFVDLAEQAEPEIRSANQLIWLDRLDKEIDNLRAALEWSQERDLESCLRLTGALWRFWDMRDYDADAFEWYAQSIKLSNGMRTIARARLLSRASVFYRNVSRNDKFLQLAHEASTLARELNDKFSLVLAMGIEGEALLSQPESAQLLLEEALRISEELGDPWLLSYTLYDLANLANRRGDHELQRTCLEKGLGQGRLSGDHRRISQGLAYLASYYLHHGKYTQAEETLREGLGLAVQIGDKGNVAERSLNLANANIFLEQYSEAEALLVESRKAVEEMGVNYYLVFALCSLGYLAWVKDNLEQFNELTSKALKIARQVDSLYALAPALYHHGFAALVNHKHRLAREALTESIHVCQKMNTNRYYGACIAGFGMLAAAEGQLERAAQIFGAYQQLAPFLPAETPFLIRKIHEQMELARNNLKNGLFEASAAKGKGMSLEQVLDFVLGETHE